MKFLNLLWFLSTKLKKIWNVWLQDIIRHEILIGFPIKLWWDVLHVIWFFCSSKLCTRILLLFLSFLSILTFQQPIMSSVVDFTAYVSLLYSFETNIVGRDPEEVLVLRRVWESKNIHNATNWTPDANINTIKYEPVLSRIKPERKIKI